MKIAAVKELLSRGMRGLVKVLVVYGINDSRLRVWGREEWKFFLSDCKYIHKGLIATIHQLSGPMRLGFSACKRCYPFSCFREARRD